MSDPTGTNNPIKQVVPSTYQADAYKRLVGQASPNMTAMSHAEQIRNLLGMSQYAMKRFAKNMARGAGTSKHTQSTHKRAKTYKTDKRGRRRLIK